MPEDLRGSRGDWKSEYPDYLGCINALDANVGRIREAIESLSIASNTVIIYTSDHGSHFRTRNSEYKRSCHDGCIRIPLIIFGGAFTGGKVQRELVSLIDLPPTILTIGGATPPAHMRGLPLQDLVQGTAQHWPEQAFLQISESQCGRAIRTKQWKYSVRAPHARGSDPASDVYEEDFLYDLKVDPNEQNNLVRSRGHLEVRQKLAKRLQQVMTKIGEARPAIIPKRSRVVNVFRRD